MIRFTRAQTQPIGVDIGSDSIKMLQVQAAGQTLSVLAAAREPLPRRSEADQWTDRIDAAVEVIRHMLRHRPFSDRRIIAALPHEMVHVKNLRLPLMPMEDLRSAIDFEVKSIFPFDVANAHVRFLHAGEVRQGTDARQEVIVIAAARSDVDTFLCQLHRTGATIESLDFEPAAIYRSVERFIRRREDEQVVNVFVDVGADRTQVVIGRGDKISFVKSIEIGGQRFHEAVALKLGITFDEAAALRRRLIASNISLANVSEDSRRDPVRQAVFDATRSTMESLAREVSLCLRYHAVTFRGYRPSRIRLVGGDAADGQLLAVFNSALPIQTEAGCPLRNVDTARMRPADRGGSMSEWTTAFGLALKLTTGRFGIHDTEPWGSITQHASSAASVEVIDLDRPPATISEVPSPFKESAVNGFTPSLEPEVVHA